MPKNFAFLPESASTIAGSVDALYLAAVGMSAFFSLLIAGLVVWLAVRYRRRHPDSVGEAGHENSLLEITWTVIPLGILVGLFFWGTKVFFTMHRVPPDAATYYVTGKQWMWKFQHPEGNREINELHIPVGKPVKLIMASEDVIHSVFVPAFRVKMDVVPGRYRTMWFKATKPGTYHLFCTEYCGAEHSKMIGSVIAMPPAEYEAWLRAGRPEKSMAASGAELFTQLACDTCHRPDSEARAPNLHGLYGSTVRLVDGSSARVDDNYLRQSILDPASQIAMGYNPIMPTYRGQITEEELHQLVLYVRELGAPPAAATAVSTNAAAETTH
jgi:cytochrome c oxidase subunit 2